MKNADGTKSSFFAGLFFACITITIWGITFVSTKYLSGIFSPLEILVIRFLMAFVCLWIVYPHRLKLTDKKHEFIFVLAGLCGVTAYQFLENISLSFTYAGNVSIIVSICPMFTAILTQIIYREKHITPLFILGFILSMTGIALITFSGNEFHLSPKGDLMALGSAVCWAFYSICISKLNALGYTSISTTRRVFFWALILMLPFVLYGTVAGGKITSVDFTVSGLTRLLDFKSIANLCFLGLGASAFCFFAWSRACEILGTVRTSVGIYIQPVITIVAAFIFLGERISFMGFAGAALTIAGLIISNLREEKTDAKV